MVHRKHLILFSLLLLLVGGIIFLLNLVGYIGFDYDYRIDKMSYKKLKFGELPKKIQTCLSDSSCNSLYGKGNGILFVFDHDNNRYQYESVPIGPWIKYGKLIDTQTNIVYRIERDMAEPNIIFNNKLYIASEYNFFKFHIRECTYSEYELK